MWLKSSAENFRCDHAPAESVPSVGVIQRLFFGLLKGWMALVGRFRPRKKASGTRSGSNRPPNDMYPMW